MGDVFRTEVSRRAKDELETEALRSRIARGHDGQSQPQTSPALESGGLPDAARLAEEEKAEDGAETPGRMAQGWAMLSLICGPRTWKRPRVGGARRALPNACCAASRGCPVWERILFRFARHHDLLSPAATLGEGAKAPLARDVN